MEWVDNLFLKGCIIGFFIAMPVGPIGMLCIQYSLTRGMRYGLVAGLGAALADTLYGVLAAFGITLISHLFIHHQIWFQLVGAIFLFYMGWKILLAKPQEKEEAPKNLTHIFITTFFLTLTNPVTFLGFAGVYAGLGVSLNEQNLFSTPILIVAIFTGSAAWWLLLSCGTARLGKRLNYKPSQLFNKISGSVILGFGCMVSLIVFQQLVELLSELSLILF